MDTIDSEGFKMIQDRFGGLILKTSLQSFTSLEEYRTKLAVAFPNWEQTGVRGFWAKISLEHTHLTTVFAEHGLEFHHAQPKYVMMTKWLTKKEPSMIPEYANQYLGVGGFVVNENNQVLVIQEKFHDVRRWKLPGGHAHKGEEIEDAARREVREETGIEAEFIGVTCFRHQTNYQHGCSDFYFICLMRPTRQDQEIKMCQQEIAACQWMDLDEYINLPDITDANRHFAKCYTEGVLPDRTIISPTLVWSYNKKTQQNCYSVKRPELPDKK